MMQSSLGGADTGATEQREFRITQSQDKANETQRKSTVRGKLSSLHLSSGNI
jgi:hypothetical protein